MLAAAKLQAILCTTRISEAEHFYSDILGLTLTGRSLGALIYEVQGTTLRVAPVPSGRPSGHTVLGFAVSAIDPVVAGLRERGVQFERFPGFPHDASGVVRAPDGSRVAWFRDPDGHLLSVVQCPSPTGS